MVNRQTSVLDKAIEFDATHSWNGFSYQGKVGVIAVLDFIIDILEVKGSIEGYSLEFEYMEDFSIKYNDNYIQIHQVKTYGIEPLSKYKDAIWILLGKSIYEENDLHIKKAFLHIAQPIINHRVNITKTEEIKTRLMAAGNPSSSKSEKYASPLELYQYVEKKGKFEDAFKKLEIYNYTKDKKHCSLEEVEEVVRQRICKYYSTVGKKEELVEKGLLDRYIECAYLALIGLIDNHVNQRHQDRQANSDEKKKILFSDILSILDGEYSTLPEKYHIYYLRNKLITDFNNYYIEIKNFILEQRKSITEASMLDEMDRNEEILENILSFFQNVHTNVDDDSLLQMCYKINPHITKEIGEELFSMDEYVNTEFLRYPFFESLLHLYMHMDEDRLNVKIDGDFYLVSTINNTMPEPKSTDSPFVKSRMNAQREATISRFAVGILENKKVYNELFNIDSIITANINGKALNEYINEVKIYKGDLEKEEVEKNKHHIMRIKDIKFVDITACNERIDKQNGR
ncbi:hypothetical protein AT261_09670 [Bacillus cereus]|uniref:ABC-three component system protein n=1 Tax=Bacillus TaxID=1386 RepID=UPI00077A8CF8|nr:ABC-three component system protein [Bacillus cereus]KXY57060.1 hypothetical protein AT261_09670 [Bacillus cereus]PEX18060.1 hypothetical protein CN452_22680 [Bacillus cereus]HDR8066656.1 hypothetical protein [Bacillus cereus]